MIKRSNTFVKKCIVEHCAACYFHHCNFIVSISEHGLVVLNFFTYKEYNCVYNVLIRKYQTLLNLRSLTQCLEVNFKCGKLGCRLRLEIR